MSLRFTTVLILSLVFNFNSAFSQCAGHSVSIEHDYGSSNGSIHIAGQLAPGDSVGYVIVYSSENPDPTAVIHDEFFYWDNPTYNATIASLPAQVYLVVFYDGFRTCVTRPEILLAGCGDPSANNYNPDVTYHDEGTCEYGVEACPSTISISVVRPDCGLNNGRINVISNGTSLQYSIDGGRSFQSNSSFENIREGVYDVVVKNHILNCSTTTSYQMTCNDDTGGGNECPTIRNIRVVSNPSSCSTTDGVFIISTTGDHNQYSGKWRPIVAIDTRF